MILYGLKTEQSNLADLGNKEGFGPLISGTFTLIILMFKRMKILKIGVEKIMIKNGAYYHGNIAYRI